MDDHELYLSPADARIVNTDLALLKALETMKDREPAFLQGRCIKPPIGCGKPITGFRDELSKREYTKSVLCQECQDKVFGDE